MAEEQKPVVEVPKDALAAEPPTETKVEETPAATTATTEPTEAAAATTGEASTSAAEETAPAAEEAAKEDATPIEEGSLEHKGSMFPKNFMYSKKFFWFGHEPVDTKALPSFKADKAAEVAHHVQAWAAETGRGLFFYGEKSDKSAPHGAIQLSEASEPVVEGTNKFHMTSKGHKHTFKASNAAERDNWVNQLKAKIAEAKELAETIKETETYQNTLASLKPAPVKKEEKAPAVAAAATTEPASGEPAAAEASKDAAAEPAAVEEPKKEEPKRRSASRKRASIFDFIGKKKEEEHTAAAPVETEAPAAESSTLAAASETPATDAAPEPTSTEATPATETPAETKSEDAKPTPTKRASIFNIPSLSFHKKKAAAPEASATSPSEEAPVPNTTEAVSDAAPRIPAVETTEPLSTDVSSPATVPTETVEAVAPVTNGETSPAAGAKSEKRKSSYPFGLMSGSKKDKPTSGDEEAGPSTTETKPEKPKSPAPFSKLRATISRKIGGKSEAKPAVATTDDAAKPADAAEATTGEPIKEEAAAPAIAEPTVDEAAVTAAVPADKPVATAAPVVAPVQ